MEGSIPLSVMRAIDNYGSFINASRCYLLPVLRRMLFANAISIARSVTNRLFLNDLSLEDLEFASCFLSVPV